MTTGTTTTTTAATPRPASPAEPVDGGAPITRARRRLWTAVRALVSTIAVLGLVVLACPGLLGVWSARADGAVPEAIELPWRWQASVLTDPGGVAAVVARAGRGDPVAVVTRDGAYRSLYPAEGGSWPAGSTPRLSPDGRYLALPYLDDPATAATGPTIVDLTTGRVKVVAAAGLPAPGELAVLGWRPDGGALLLASVLGDRAHLALLTLDTETPDNETLDTGTPDTGTLATLAEVSSPAGPGGWRAAFSPDGARVGFESGGSLHLVDDTGTLLWSVALDGRQLAGDGAFTPDGSRIALVGALPCREPCVEPSWTVTYVESADGGDARGPALPSLPGAWVRAVGWSTRADGTTALVAVRYLPRPTKPAVQGPNGELTAPPADGSTDDGTGPADLYELAPGEPARMLLDAPYEVTDLEVPADLVRAGRFHGHSSMPSLLPIEPGRLRLFDMAVATAVLGGLVVAVTVVVALTGRIRPRRR